MPVRWLKFILTPILKPMALRFMAADRLYRYKGLRLVIKAGVFHPGMFFSTQVLLRFLEKQPLEGKSLLEMGAGSGLISMMATRWGANATATDISPTAIDGLLQNAKSNHLSIHIVHSDLFGRLPADQVFDYILINPPYYPKDAATEAEQAWYCGAEFGYFQKLFAQLATRRFGKCFMILSEDCQIETISKIAGEHGFALLPEEKQKRLWEWNFIYRISEAG